MSNCIKLFLLVEKSPVVQVVVEGGYSALGQVAKNVERGVPVVVCAGTGRTADVLTDVMIATSKSRSFDGLVGSCSI